MLFDGRIAENFKLLTGTWVAVGALRTRLISAAGVLSDAVICGHDAEYVGGDGVGQPGRGAPADRRRGRRRARRPGAPRPPRRRAAHASTRTPGSASRIERLLLLAQPPSLDAGEITDKGYLNQRRTLQCRAADVARLYADPPDPAVITASD